MLGIKTATADPDLVEQVAASYLDLRLLALANLRTMTRLARGEPPGAESSWVKIQREVVAHRLLGLPRT